jgi:hypothetical protein
MPRPYEALTTPARIPALSASRDLDDRGRVATVVLRGPFGYPISFGPTRAGL